MHKFRLEFQVAVNNFFVIRGWFSYSMYDVEELTHFLKLQCILQILLSSHSCITFHKFQQINRVCLIPTEK